jgi:tetratricopeptide (TPR) repeat protein
MRNKIFAVLILALLTGLAAAQTATIKGKVTDREGKPMEGAKLQFKNLDDGTKYELKINKKGEYFSLGIKPGPYDVTLLSKEGQQVYKLNKVPVSMDDTKNIFDIDLKKEMGAQAAASAQPASGQSSGGNDAVSTDDAQQTAPASSSAGAAAPQTPSAPQNPNAPVNLTEEQLKKLTPEQRKEYDEYQKNLKENSKIKGLNSILSQAQDAAKGGNTDQAIQLVQGATQQDSNRPLLWAILGDYQAQSARKITDPAARKQRYGEAHDSFQKAVQLGQTATDGQSKSQLANWRLGLGTSADGAGRYDDAIAAFTGVEQDAAATNPKLAGLAHYNHGLILTKTGKVDEAAAEFDKAVQLDPNQTEAYYQKGTALIAKATADKNGKIVAPPGTEEAFQKYLELNPNGKNAESATAQLEFLGAKVQTKVKNK